MKTHNTFKILAVGIACCSSLLIAAQEELRTPPSGGNKKAWVGERIGITDVSIQYDRPGVKGREGRIFGTNVVHKGFIDMRPYGTCKGAPWRAGANENTTIEFSTDVKVEGKDLPAGKYGFFVAYDSLECTVIFNKNNTSWGNYFYNDKEDVLRVKVKPVRLDKSVEWLTYRFSNETEQAATVVLEWEKLQIPVKVEVDLVKTELADFRLELASGKGFSWSALMQGAYFCVEHNTNLEEGLSWSNRSLLGDKNFQTLSCHSMILEKLGRKAAADSAMKEALPLGSMTDLHQYGRALLAQKKAAEALVVFQLNAQKHPKEFTTFVGLARGYSATGDYKKALVNAKAALPLSPDPNNMAGVHEMIKKLDAGKDVN
jgi:hypothetical protein